MNWHCGLQSNGEARGQAGVCALLVAALTLIAACAQAAPAAQPTATSAPPTATPRPTATSLPPTTTPLPTPTPEPVVENPPLEDVVYYEPPEGTPRTLSIRYPETGQPPYPWVLVTRCLECRNAQYDIFAGELLARGYAVVQLSTIGDEEDSFCAWAWLEDHSAECGLDVDRAIAFSHGVGTVATTLGLADETLWTEWLQGCPSPAPSPVHIAGVATYSSWFLIPDGTLASNAGGVAAEMGVSRATVLDTVAVLQELPPDEWRSSDLLDDEMRAIASRLPLYYVHGPKPAGQMPAFLIMHGEIEGMAPITESQAMANALADAGLSVETFWLPGSTFMDIASRIGDVPQQVAEAIDTFVRDLSADR